MTNEARNFAAVGVIAVLSTGVMARQAPTAPDASQPTAPQQPRPVFETRADIVLVDVNVVSANGEPVEGLTPADFVLTINGQQRVVASAQFVSSRATATVAEPERLADVSSNDRETTGRALLFVVDENYLRAGAHRAVLRTAERVMERLLPGDLVGLARLPTGRGGVEFTTDRARIRRALDTSMGQQPARQQERVRLSEAAAYERNDQTVWRQVIQRECSVGDSMIAIPGGGAGSFEQNACIKDIEAQAKYVVNDASARTRVSISAFEGLAERLASIKLPVNIVLISEGLFIGRDRDDLGHLARLAARARISFFVVQPDESMFDMDVPKIFTTARDDTLMSEGLEQLAGFTRGSYYRVSTTGAGVFERIGRELSGYYLLSFEPTEADRTSRDRRIRVEVKRRGLTVRARTTFALGEDAAPEVPLLPADQIKQLLSAPLPSPGLPMRVASYRVTNDGDAKVRVIVSAEIGEAAAEPAEWPVGLYLIDKDDRVVANMTAPMTLTPATDRTSSPRLLITSFLIEPGDYTLRLAAIGPEGVSGSVHHQIEARLMTIGRGSLRVSDLMLTSDTGPGGGPRPVPSGIVYSETMAAMVELAGDDLERLNASTVTVHVAESEASPPLVTAEGQSPPRTAGQRMFVAPLKLAVLPPGEYVARAVVSVPGQPDTEVVRAFRLAPVAVSTDASPIAARVADEAPVPPPVARIVAPVVRFSADEVLKPEIVRGFVDALQRTHPVSTASASIVQRARNGEYTMSPPDGSAPQTDEPMLSFIRGLAQLQKQQYAQAAAWFQLTLKEASDFLGAAFYLGAVHAAGGRDHDAVGAWQMALIGDGGAAVYPLLVDGLLRIGDGQSALDLIAEAPDAWPNDRARRRRVATAQAMIGQFEPALETLQALLDEMPQDVDLLYVALQVLYRQHLARPLDAADRERFERYASRYAAAGGPNVALVETWRRYVAK